jgi:hypothetical protein
MAWFSGLLPTPDAVLNELNSQIRVSAISLDDFPDWESRLEHPANSPIPYMRAQNQRRNDCQGQSLANGEEKRAWYCRQTMIQRSDIYAYNASEYVSGKNQVGKDQGTTIGSGVTVLTKGLQDLSVNPGLMTEADWPYNTYETNYRKFATRAQAVRIDQTFVSEHQAMPDFRTLMCGLAAGGSAHIGTWWPPAWKQLEGRRLMDSPPRGGGGHATEIIWAVKVTGKWYLVVWNSHGDQYYLMSEACYSALRQKNFDPFGAYLLMPDQPKKRYLDWGSDSPWFE